MLVGSSVLTALRAKEFDRPLGTLYREGKSGIPASVAVKYSQSKIAFMPPGKSAKASAKRFLGVRSPREVVRQLGGPVGVLVSVVDNTGYDALTAVRDGVSTQPFKKRLRLVHAKLHRFPFWIAEPVRAILGQWHRTIRRAERAVDYALNFPDPEALDFVQFPGLV